MLNKLTEYFKADKKRLPSLILLSVLIISIVVLCVNCVTYNVSIASLTDSYDVMDDNVGGIFDPNRVEQTFVAKHNKICAIGFRFGTYLRKCNGEVHVNVGRFSSDGTREVLTEQTIVAAQLVDNQFYVFEFEPVMNSKGNLFSVIVTASNTGDLPVTLWMSENDAYSDGTLYVNGQVREGDLNTQFYYVNNFGYDEVVFIVIFLFLLILAVVCAKYELLIFSPKFIKKYFFPILIFVIVVLTVSSVKLDTSGSSLYYRPNFISLGLLLILIGALVLLEKRIGFYTAIKKFVQKQIAKVRLLKEENNLIRVIIRLAMLATFVAFSITALVLLTFNAVYSTAKIFLFTLCVLFVVAYVVDSYVSGRNIERIFLGVFLAIGVMFCIILPLQSTNTPDEFIHYDRTITLRNALFGPEQTFADKMMANGAYRLSFINPDKDMYINLIADDKFTNNVYSSLINPYSYISYLPCAIVMFLCDLIGADFVLMMMLSRLVNVLIYVSVIYTAVRRVRSGKLIFLTICFAPMPFLLASSFSYDFWVNAWIALFFALFITVLQDKERRFTLKDAILISLSAFFACGPKAIYCVLMLPLFFIPKEKFNNAKQSRIFKLIAAFTMLLILLSFLLPFVVDMDSRTDNRGGADVNAAGQIKYVLTNLFAFCGMLIRFLGNYVSFGNATGEMASYFYLGFPSWIYGSFAIALIFIAAVLDKDEADLFERRYRIKLTACASSVITLALVAAALYVSFTPVGFYTVNGCQYRYIIPTLIPFAYFVGSGRIRHGFNRRRFECVMLSCVMLNVLITFYNIVIKAMI